MLTMQICIMCRKAYGCMRDDEFISCNTCQDQYCLDPDIEWDMQYSFCGNCNNDKLIIVCFSCKKMKGCVENRMGGVRKLCSDCDPKSCWLLSHDGKLIETSTICDSCLQKRRISHVKKNLQKQRQAS